MEMRIVAGSIGASAMVAIIWDDNLNVVALSLAAMAFAGVFPWTSIF